MNPSTPKPPENCSPSSSPTSPTTSGTSGSGGSSSSASSRTPTSPSDASAWPSSTPISASSPTTKTPPPSSPTSTPKSRPRPLNSYKRKKPPLPTDNAKTTGTSAEAIRARLDVLEAQRMVSTVQLRTALIQEAKRLLPAAIRQARGSRKKPGAPALLRQEALGLLDEGVAKLDGGHHALGF